MGAIQEPTEAMGNWGNEMRGESWWLRRTGRPGDGGGTDPAANAWTFPAGEQPRVLAALAQAREYIERHGVDTDTAEHRGWRLVAEGGLVTLSGPFAMLGTDSWPKDDFGAAARYDAAEIEYIDLLQLTALFAPAVNGASREGE